MPISRRRALRTEPGRSSVLVTGGLGFIGSYVTEELSGHFGHVGATTISADTPPAPIRINTVDLNDPEAAVKAMEGFDHVVHLAARAGGIQFQTAEQRDVFSANRIITDNVISAAIETGVQRLFLASSLVIYRHSDRDLTEDSPVVGLGDDPSPYAWSKITDEVVARWHSEVSSVVGRFGNVYGPGAPLDEDRSTVVHALIHRAAQLPNGAEFQVWGDGSAVRSFIFVEDAAHAVRTILVGGEPFEAYNIDTSVPVTIAELAEKILDLVNPTLKLVFDASKPAGAPYRVASSAKLRSLGFEPAVTLDEGLRRTVEWYRAVHEADT